MPPTFSLRRMTPADAIPSWFPIVYYSGLWYSRFADMRLSDLNGPFVEREVETHRKHFRVLALFFDHVYLARTHLLTQTVENQHEIAARLLATDDSAYLRDVGTLCVSVLPGIDAKSDTERITSRAGITDVVTYAGYGRYLATQAALPSILIDSRKESRSNTESFGEYGRGLRFQSADLARTMADHIARSELRDLPFFHEAFIARLRASVDESTFSKIWRDTNSIYLTSAAPNRGGVVAYFNALIEAPTYRYRPTGIDRYLYHPDSLRTFLGEFLGAKEVDKFLNAPATQALACLRSPGYAWWALDEFRRAYAQLVFDISCLTRSNVSDESVPSQATVQAWFRLALSGEINERLNRLDAIAKGADLIEGAMGSKGLTAAGLRIVRTPLQRVLQRQRHEKLYSFFDPLRTALKQLK
jgi:hypothetical protein